MSEPGPVKENSVSINLNHSSSTIKIPAKIDHSSKKLPKISKKVKPAESKSHKNAKAKTEPAKAKSVKATKAKAKAESRSTRKERGAALPQKQATKRAVRQASQPMVDQNGDLHLNPQQIRTLEHKMPKAAKVAKAVKKIVAQSSPYSSAKASNTSKQGLTLKHRNAAHPVSNVHRVTLPIQGILPATRMDPYTWVYSLVGLTIMIVSGRAFFSKKRK